MKPPNFTDSEYQQLLQTARDPDRSRRVLADWVEQFHREVRADLQSKGVPAPLLDYLDAHRRVRRSAYAAVRDMFKPEPMPQGAAVLYWQDPESSDSSNEV